MATQIARLVGGAGTGKTTELLRLMDFAMAKHNDPCRVGFVSFTRAARREASERAADRFNATPHQLEHEGWFRTIHSICYKCLGVGDELLSNSKESIEWITEALQAPVSSIPGDIDNDIQVVRFAREDATLALELWNTSRVRLKSFSSIHEEAVEVEPWIPSRQWCRAVIQRYEQAKRLDGRLDFTDILGKFAGWWFHVDGHEKCDPAGLVPDVPVWFFDEQQDASPLLHEVCKRLSSSAEWCYIAGDPYQCQPAGTMVRTKEGDKPIEDLNSKEDFLVAYNPKDGRFYGTGKQLAFKRACRTVDSSNVWKITLENGDVLQATPTHKWLVRFQKPRKFATYVMKNGQRWRVGTVQLWAGKKNAGENRLGMRTQQEAAEAAWILKTFSTDKEARAYEQIIRCKYGLPQITFRPVCGNSNLDQVFIDEVFRALGDLTQNGIRCLREHRLHVNHPFYRPASGAKRGSQITSRLETCNILPGMTLIPRFIKPEDGRSTRQNGVHRTEEMEKKTRLSQRVEWVKIVSVEPGEPGTATTVYSLDVEKHHTYVSDGYVTCNSIFGWIGADPSLFLKGWDYTVDRIMPRSYRCPDKILRRGEQILRPCSDYFDRGIAPADHAGQVDYEAAEKVDMCVADGQPWMILARTNFLANRLGGILDSAHIPWTSTKGNSRWTAPVRHMAFRALCNLQAGAPVDGLEWQAVLSQIKSTHEGRTLLARGTKSEWKYLEPDEAQSKAPWVLPAELKSLGATDHLIELIRTGDWKHLSNHAVPYLNAVKRVGVEGVENPTVQVGTIHSAKGMECDNVAVLTSIPKQCEIGRSNPRGADESRRVAYVAVTRAKKRLVILKERNPKFELEV